MKNIFRDGIVINQNGVDIELTPETVIKIEKIVKAQNGRDSLEFFCETIEGDIECAIEEDVEQLREYLTAAEKMMEDDNACIEVWDTYLEEVCYDTGDIEFDVVHDLVEQNIKRNRCLL